MPNGEYCDLGQGDPTEGGCTGPTITVGGKYQIYSDNFEKIYYREQEKSDPYNSVPVTLNLEQKN